MKLAKTSVRRFKKEYQGIMYQFHFPQRIYDKTMKANARMFAEMVSEAIKRDEERLSVNIFVATDEPLTKPFSILDRRENSWIPDIYDYCLVKLEENA